MKKYLIICVMIFVGVTYLSLFTFVNNQNPIQTQSDYISSHTIETSKIINGEKISVFSTLIGNITIGIPVPESLSTIRIYRGYFRDGDLVEKRFRSFKDITNPIPANQAPEAAKEILEQYGGLPESAQLQGSAISYANLIDPQTDEVVARIPQCTFVSWYRTIDGMDIEGGSDTIRVELGENGEVNRIYKRWRTYTPLGNVSIISAHDAINKLQAGDVLNPVSDIYHEDVSIYSIHLSYYIKGVNEPEVTLQPIWVFYGETSSGESLPFFVYARQFANFTATPTSGTAPLTVSFTDTSYASPVQWYWDFGDNTNSTEPSPTHTYTSAGTYNISLRAWNDLGSDTIVRTNLVQARTISPPIVNFTATPLSGKAPLIVQFNDTSENVPTEWSWDFGDMTYSTEKDPVHIYTVAGNYTVNLTVKNNDGIDTKSENEFITVLPPNPPVVEFSANTTNGKAPLAVQFTDASTNTPTAWEWSFGDGYVSTEQHPVHRYSVSGTYDVTLNAINADGRGNLMKPAYITVTEPGNAIDLIDQLIVYIDNQRNVPHIYQRIMIGELMDVKRSLNENRPGDAVMGMKFFKLTVNLFRHWPLTKDQASTMQNSADAIIKAINLPVNQAAIDQTKSLSADVKSLHLSDSVERPLLWNLDSAVFMLECDKDQAATTYLNIFIGSVRAQDGKKIPHDKAARLITKAEVIKATL